MVLGGDWVRGQVGMALAAELGGMESEGLAGVDLRFGMICSITVCVGGIWWYRWAASHTLKTHASTVIERNVWHV